MSALIIDDEYALPAPEGTAKRTWGYVRLLSDPLLLESTKTGDLYQRRDGRAAKAHRPDRRCLVGTAGQQGQENITLGRGIAFVIVLPWTVL